ncbi:hypothetical protein Hanom_Chr06g00520221 [Helianthus anomalus]
MLDGLEYHHVISGITRSYPSPLGIMHIHKFKRKPNKYEKNLLVKIEPRTYWFKVLSHPKIPLGYKAMGRNGQLDGCALQHLRPFDLFYPIILLKTIIFSLSFQLNNMFFILLSLHFSFSSTNNNFQNILKTYRGWSVPPNLQMNSSIFSLIYSQPLPTTYNHFS